MEFCTEKIRICLKLKKAELVSRKLKMNKLLVICGPTATGKTSLALHLAKVFGGELISADSRQVYKHMDIGTGKEIPKDFGFRNSDLEFKGVEVGYYTDGDTRIWGYDLVEPKREFSVAQYIKIADDIIKNIWERGKRPILIGGTGFYIQGIVDGIPTAQIPKNKKLRNLLKGKKVNELFEILAQLNPVKSASMNASDKKNPRRLIRAIEVASWRLEVRDGKLDNRTSHFQLPISTLFIGLTAPKKVLEKKIERRVDERVRQGIENEIKSRLKEGVSWRMQSMTSLGYRQWRDFFEGKKGKDEVINIWKKQEVNFTKRQIAWFKRDKRINWFDITQRDFQKEVEKLVKKWYSSNRNGIS